eukprot:CAMPEP_0198224236 /NCGR_PEP_ID=MMETSP1445-20131203/95957_1 /TAXON_ID=36898 /ORGANISM="Pyramimonas sp., Strain CCMP2087" /LENGTH=556 /DNA_ID=CAMNT_0043903329 /DNA_START=91 /DNA_END=1758 /DNA_ORIENTATION=-
MRRPGWRFLVFTAILATVWHNLMGLNNYHSKPVVYLQGENGANVVRSNENPNAKNPSVVSSGSWTSGSAKDESPHFASELETSRGDNLQGWIHSSLKGQDSKSPNEITREEQSVLGDAHRDMSRDEFSASVRRPTSKSRDEPDETTASVEKTARRIERERFKQSTDRMSLKGSQTIFKQEERSKMPRTQEGASSPRTGFAFPSSQQEQLSSSASQSAVRGGSEASEAFDASVSGRVPHQLDQRCPSGKAWRAAHSKGNDPIVMSRKIYNVGSKVVNHLRTVGTVTKALHEALPEADVFENSTFASCAVVASAGILLQRRYGRHIDAHDAVFRFNSAYTQGAEEYVGSRTTVRLVNRENFGWREYDDEITLQHITTETLLREYHLRRKEKPLERLHGIDTSFYKRVITADNSHPTSGFFGTRLALELCNCVYLYGFVRNWFGYMTYHYHDDYTPRTTQAKRDSTEFPLIKSLLKEYTGRLVYVHPCVTDPECPGCPLGAKCVKDVPHPVPSEGHCYGHGPPGGHPELKHWTAREYFSASNWTASHGRRLMSATMSEH